MSAANRRSILLPCLTTVLFLPCAALWSLAIPPFETPDEPGHARYVNFLAAGGRLPLAGEEAPGEAHQPPLYYALAAGVARVGRLGEIPVEPVRNPRFRWYGGTQENKYLHDAAESLPPLRRLRLMSVAMGAGTAALIYLMGAGSGVLSLRSAAIAAAAAAFLPQFTFISASLNNDNLANLFSAAALASLTAAMRRPARLAPWGVAGSFAGLGLLAKFTGLTILPCGLIALALARRAARREAQPAPPARAAALFLFPALLIPAPLLLRNVLVLGDPLGVSALASTLPNLLDPKNLASAYFLTEFPVVLFESFWGRFGWMSFRLPAVLYLGALAATLAAAMGLALRWLRRVDALQPSQVLFAAAIAIQLAQIVAYNLTFTQAQGRFLFPVLGPIAILLCSGMTELARRLGGVRMNDWRGAILIAALAAANLCILRFVVMPGYQTAAAPP
ncbi:MAG TPA: DUF2142 domain-containing protein [Candidatus Polarisedimenticolia bacterium]